MLFWTEVCIKYKDRVYEPQGPCVPFGPYLGSVAGILGIHGLQWIKSSTAFTWWFASAS